MSIWASHEDIDCLSYATGWSNHYPTTTGDVERPATIDLASIPSWCVPGRRDEHEHAPGPRLRLGVESHEHDWHNPTRVLGTQTAAVVLNEEAVRELRDQLTYWLDLPKTYPLPSPKESA